MPRLTGRPREDGRAGGGRLAAPDLASAAVVLLGAVLIVIAALQQPYNQNEWAQMAPYGDPDLVTAVTGTRQPPLDPFLGVMVHRLLGVGHLEQRLVPVGSGIASLALMAVLLRRLRLGWAAPAALLLMATAPLFLRYSAYTRPYALPVTLMLACAVAGSLWLDTGRRRWLVAAFVGSLLLPLSRVPEPSVFLTVSVAVLVVLGAARRLPRNRAWPLAGALLLGLATAGVAMLLRLLSIDETSGGDSLIDTHPGRALARVPSAVVRIWETALPRYAEWFPWWPLTLLVVLVGLLLPASRRRLLTTWYWLPLLLAPLAFLVLFHTFVPLDLRTYRIRFGYFAVPPLVVLAGVGAHELGEALRRRSGRAGHRLRWLGAGLVAALVVSQLPTTWRVLTEDDSIDLAAAGRVLGQRLPDDAVVVFDGPGRLTGWRQPFYGQERFLVDDTKVFKVAELARVRALPAAVGDGPVWLLLVDAECISSSSCDLPRAEWDSDVEGYRPVERMSHMTLYEPVGGQAGVDGVLEAMRSLMKAYGVDRSLPNAVLVARILVEQGQPEAAVDLLEQLCDDVDPSEQSRCREYVGRGELGRALEPFSDR